MYKNKTYYASRKIHNGFLPDYLENKRQNFVPEIEPKLIPYNEKTWKKMFPEKKGINYQDLQLSNIGIYSIFYPNSGDEVAKVIRSYIPNKKATITDANLIIGRINEKKFSDNSISLEKKNSNKQHTNTYLKLSKTV